MKTFVLSLIVAFFVSTGSGQHLLSLRQNGEGPSRMYHPVHYLIDIKLDEVRATVAGVTTVTLTPYVDSLRDVVFDAEGMQFEKIWSGKDSLAFTSDSNTVTVHLAKSASQKDTVGVSIRYSCKPKEGMTFIKADSAYPSRRWQIWSQGESATNHFWFPCYDFPNEKSTSEVFVTVNAKFSALSNGKLIGVKENKKEGTKTFHWKESKPHPSYLVMVAAGEYTVLRDNAGKLPLEYYAYPDDTLNARIAFKETPAMIKFFNEKIGFAYPWEKYAQILCQDHFGGMENTSANRAELLRVLGAEGFLSGEREIKPAK
jgi:aminopeptidase N